MKKLLVLLLALILTLSFVACGKDDTSSEDSTKSDVVSQVESSETTTSVDNPSVSSTESVTSSKPQSVSSNTSSNKKNNTSSKTSKPATTSSQPKPVKPTKLNPKTDFKYGTYKAEFFADNNQAYYKAMMFFYKEFDTVQQSYTCYYTLEGCKKKYEDWGETFNENDFSYDSTITLKGVTYYDIGNWGSIPVTYEMTDTAIKVNDGEIIFSLNTNGTLKVDSSSDTSYGTAGTIYTFASDQQLN